MEGQSNMVLWLMFAAGMGFMVLLAGIWVFIRKRAYLSPVKRELKKEKQWLRRGEYNAAMVKGRQNLELLLKVVAASNGIQLDNTAAAQASARNRKEQYRGYRRLGKMRVMTHQQFAWWMEENGYLDRVARWEMNEVRLIGNKAVHENFISKEDAWNQYNYLEDILRLVSEKNPGHGKRKTGRKDRGAERGPRVPAREGKKNGRKKSGQKKTGGNEKRPDTGKKPEAVKKPEAAKKAEPVKKPEPAKKPEAVKKPEAAKKPEPVKKPEAAKKPEPVKKPEAAKKPETAKKPAGKPENEKQPENKAAETGTGTRPENLRKKRKRKAKAADTASGSPKPVQEVKKEEPAAKEAPETRKKSPSRKRRRRKPGNRPAEEPGIQGEQREPSSGHPAAAAAKG